MARPKKPPRLLLRKARDDRQAMWVILDGGREISTGYTEDRLEHAQRVLAELIAGDADPIRPFEILAKQSFLDRVDGWRLEQPDLPTQAEAIRQLAELGLRVSGWRKPRPKK